MFVLVFDVQYLVGFFYNIFYGKVKIWEQFVSWGGFIVFCYVDNCVFQVNIFILVVGYIGFYCDVGGYVCWQY